MKSGIFAAVAVVCSVFANAADAAVATWSVNCNTGAITNTLGFNDTSHTGATALGAVLGTDSTSGLANGGDTIGITGICNEDVAVIGYGGLLITNDNNSNTFVDTDGIEGQLEFSNSRGNLVNGILVGNLSTVFADPNPGTLTANVYIHDFSDVKVVNSHILNGPAYGIRVGGNSGGTFRNITVSGNGTNDPPGTDPGIFVNNDSSVVLGTGAGTQGVTISGNAGGGIDVFGASSANIFAANIANNEGTTTGNAEVSVGSASSGYISSFATGSVTISATGTGAAAVNVTGASFLRVDNFPGVAGNGVSITGNATNGALAVRGGSHARLQGSSFSSPSTSTGVLRVAEGSSIDLFGGNNICAGTLSGTNCTIQTGASAVAIDHVSSLHQLNGAVETGNYYPAAAESIFGAGSVQEQSTIDLGEGLFLGSPSLTWTLSGTEIINVQQNSSFRLSGGVTISGGNGSKIQQGSNAFFNVNNGGTNNAVVTCGGSAGNPAAHIANPTLVTPNVVTHNLADTQPGGSVASQSGVCLNF